MEAVQNLLANQDQRFQNMLNQAMSHLMFIANNSTPLQTEGRIDGLDSSGIDQAMIEADEQFPPRMP